jgi:hypothetical protein
LSGLAKHACGPFYGRNYGANRVSLDDSLIAGQRKISSPHSDESYGHEAIDPTVIIKAIEYLFPAGVQCPEDFSFMLENDSAGIVKFTGADDSVRINHGYAAKRNLDAVV